MKRKLLFALLLLFLLELGIGPGLAEGTDRILAIWDDADNLDGSRPESVVYRIVGETVEVDSIPEYTSDGPVYRDNRIIFIHHHRPEVSARSVSNEMMYGMLRIMMTAVDPGPEEKFAVTLRLSSPGVVDYTCEIGDTTITVSDDSVILLSAGQTAVLTLPIGTRWETEQEEKIRYETTVAVDPQPGEQGEPGYTASGEIDAAGTVVVYNNIPKVTSFTVTKRWDGAVGERITLNLYANGKEVDAGFFQVNHRYTAEDLPMYDYDGNRIIYTATETFMEGYLTAYVNYGEHAEETDVLYSGGTVVNREVAEFRVRKTWIGLDGTAPEIKLHLYDGSHGDEPVEIKSEPVHVGDMYIWKLPIAYSDHLPDYYVLEEPMKGMIAEYFTKNGEKTDRARNGDRIRNTLIPPTGDNARVMPWLVCLILAGAVLMGVRKRR